MPVLKELPIELLLQILGLLSRVDVRKMCLVSLFFNSLAEPFVYETVRLGQQALAFTPFLRAVLPRPTLAGYVRTLELTWCDDPDSSNLIAIDTLSAAEMHRLGLTQSPWHSPWTERAQAILLLHVLPNLQELVIDWCDTLREYIEDTITIPIESLPAGLKSLQIFDGCGSLNTLGTTHLMIHALLRLPNIRTISFNMESTEDDRHNYELDTLISSTEHLARSSVTDLSFVWGNLSSVMLNKILQQPRALTHFTYMDSDNYSSIESTTFQEALNHLRPTLQYLYLGWIRALETRDGEEYDIEHRTIGSLREWPVLRTLRCSLTTLVGNPSFMTSRLVDVVPAVIRVLDIDQDDYGWYYLSGDRSSEMWTESGLADQILELLGKKEEYRLHALAQLTIQGSVTDTIEKRVQLRDRLRAASDACGRVSVCVDVV